MTSSPGSPPHPIPSLPTSPPTHTHTEGKHRLISRSVDEFGQGALTHGSMGPQQVVLSCLSSLEHILSVVSVPCHHSFFLVWTHPPPGTRGGWMDISAVLSNSAMIILVHESWQIVYACVYDFKGFHVWRNVIEKEES